MSEKELFTLGITTIGALLGAYLGVHLAALPIANIWPSNSSEWASWVQAIGSILAIFTAILVMYLQHKHSEQLLGRQFEQAAAETKNAILRRLRVNLMIVACSATGIKSTIDVLSAVQQNDLTWTLKNQADLAKCMIRPAMNIPLHELSTPEIVLQVFTITSLGERLENCIKGWLASEAPDLQDVYTTMKILKEDWTQANATFQATIAGLSSQET